MVIAVIVLSLLTAAQFLIIWRLLDRLLMQANIPKLGPVRTTPPPDAPEPQAPRRRIVAQIPLGD